MAIAFHAKATTRRSEQNGRAWLAWHIAAWQRSKKLPAFDRILIKEPKQPMHWEEQMRVMDAFAKSRRLTQGKGK